MMEGVTTSQAAGSNVMVYPGQTVVPPPQATGIAGKCLWPKALWSSYCPNVPVGDELFCQMHASELELVVRGVKDAGYAHNIVARLNSLDSAVEQLMKNQAEASLEQHTVKAGSRKNEINKKMSGEKEDELHEDFQQTRTVRPLSHAGNGKLGATPKQMDELIRTLNFIGFGVNPVAAVRGSEVSIELRVQIV